MSSAVGVVDRPLGLKLKVSSRQQKEYIAGYLFISPWIVGFLVFVVYPLFMSIYYSFTEWDLFQTPKWFGLGNYIRLVQDKLFWNSLRVTATYAAMRVPAGIFFGLGMAMLLHHGIKGRSFFRLLYYAPAVLPPVAISLMWTWIFSPSDGVLNNFLAIFGIRGLKWLQDPYLVLPSFLMMAIWSLMGKNMLVYLAGLNNVPEQLIESAAIDGASGSTTFWYIKLPMLTPIIFYELVYTLIESFRMFTQAYVMTQGGPRNASQFYVYYLFVTAFKNQEMGYASSLAWVLFFITLTLTMVVFVSSNKWVYYEGGKK